MKISESEEMVMCVLWGGEDPDLETVTNTVNARFKKTWKIQTVATFLTRLEMKGYISIYKVGRYSHYHPIVSLVEYRKEKMQQLKDMLFNGDAGLIIKELESESDAESY